jgi:hypothetical protein
MVKNERTLAVTDEGGAEIDADEAFDQVLKRSMMSWKRQRK